MKNNLETYRVLYLVSGILNLLGVLGFMTYGFLGTLFLGHTDRDAEITSWVFMLVGIVGASIFLIFGIINLLASKYIKEKRNYNFVFVAAVISCISGVLRLILGVFTIIEITKPEVKALFYSEEDNGVVY